jgi:hypothetical protein
VLQAAAGVEGEEKAGDAVAIISYGEKVSTIATTARICRPSPASATS